VLHAFRVTFAMNISPLLVLTTLRHLSHTLKGSELDYLMDGLTYIHRSEVELGLAARQFRQLTERAVEREGHLSEEMEILRQLATTCEKHATFEPGHEDDWLIHLLLTGNSQSYEHHEQTT